MTRPSVDWGTGCYETTAAELEPVSRAAIDRAAPAPGDVVVDLACGTGNAALLAAARGAQVIGVDGAPRLLEVARARATSQDLKVDFRHGDLLSVPVADAAADVVISVFGIIFAADPGAALAEVARILHPDGRVLLTGWIPAGPIDAMLAAAGRVAGRITGAPPPPRRFAWSDAVDVGRVAAEAGLQLTSTLPGRLAIRAASPEAYVDAARQHPMALAMRAAIERAGAGAELDDAMLAVLREANEDPRAFLVHSPYVIHELRAL